MEQCRRAMTSISEFVRVAEVIVDSHYDAPCPWCGEKPYHHEDLNVVHRCGNKTFRMAFYYWPDWVLSGYFGEQPDDLGVFRIQGNRGLLGVSGGSLATGAVFSLCGSPEHNSLGRGLRVDWRANGDPVLMTDD